MLTDFPLSLLKFAFKLDSTCVLNSDTFHTCTKSVKQWVDFMFESFEDHANFAITLLNSPSKHAYLCETACQTAHIN